jgi:hypothetical protein
LTIRHHTAIVLRQTLDKRFSAVRPRVGHANRR